MPRPEAPGASAELPLADAAPGSAGVPDGAGGTRPPRPATLHDVAREAGVSLITASRALSRPEVVSAKTIARVQQAAAATGYIPNLLAGGLKSQRSLMVAALMPTISMQQFLPTVQALTETLNIAGYQVMLGQSGYDRQREDALLNAMLGRRPDGLVVNGLVQSPLLRDRLRRQGIPVVETWELTPQPVDMLVGFSHEQVGATVAAYFRSKGWQRIGIASGDDPRAARRRAAFLAVLGGTGQEAVPVALVPAPTSMARGRECLARLLARTPDLQAVFCSSDALAQGVMIEALARGLRVPEDLAICGFGNAEFTAHTVPALSTVHIDSAGIGRRAAEMIVARCRGEVVLQPVCDLGFRIVERQST